MISLFEAWQEDSKLWHEWAAEYITLYGMPCQLWSAAINDSLNRDPLYDEPLNEGFQQPEFAGPYSMKCIMRSSDSTTEAREEGRVFSSEVEFVFARSSFEKAPLIKVGDVVEMLGPINRAYDITHVFYEGIAKGVKNVVFARGVYNSKFAPIRKIEERTDE